MIIALWIIAICEVIRIFQNTLQLINVYKSQNKQNWAYEEFVKSLKQSDKEFVEKMLREFDKEDT